MSGAADSSAAASGLALSWSGGKDSALALHTLCTDASAPQMLMTTVAQETGEVTVHGVHGALLHAQARALELPVLEIQIPTPCSDAHYAQRMSEAFSTPPLQQIDTVAFGDLFLEDIRDFRTQRLAEIDRAASFPLWGRDTAELAEVFISTGFHAIIVSVDLKALDISFLGRTYDHRLLEDLPSGVDPCGENGEFHTFVFDGPLFRAPIPFQRARIRESARHAWLTIEPLAVVPVDLAA